MSTNNPVFQVLVTAGNQAPLAAGNPLSALNVGQIGVFSVHTGLSVGAGTALNLAKDIYLAVGTSPTNANPLVDINKSAGQHIQSERVTAYTNRCYTAPAPMIVDITDFTPKCETEYAIKIEFRNQQIYLENGYNQFTKTFSEMSGCCDGNCADCGDIANGSALALAMVNQINKDPDQLVLADLLDYTTTSGSPVVVPIEDYQDWVDDPDNEGDSLGIRLTTTVEAVNSWYDINLKYDGPRGTFIIPSLVEGFLCNGTITTVQQLTYAEGSGYDLKQKEYFAGGWNGRPGPYRVSALNGVAQNGFRYFVSESANYTQTILTYDPLSVSNFEKYAANLETIIATPCADATTRNGLIAILDALLPQFSANAGNSALCGCVGDETTDEYAVANNGLKALA